MSHKIYELFTSCDFSRDFMYNCNSLSRRWLVNYRYRELSNYANRNIVLSGYTLSSHIMDHIYTFPSVHFTSYYKMFCIKNIPQLPIHCSTTAANVLQMRTSWSTAECRCSDYYVQLMTFLSEEPISMVPMTMPVLSIGERWNTVVRIHDMHCSSDTAKGSTWNHSPIITLFLFSVYVPGYTT